MKPARLVLLATIFLTPYATAQEVKSVLVGADPSGEIIDGKLWIYPTGRGDNLQAWSEQDGKWAVRGDLLGLKSISWVRADRAPKHYLWAPDLAKVNGRYLLYFSVGPQDYAPSRLGVAVCAGPAGPCADSGKPLLTGGKGFEAIDPMVFADPATGVRYLYAGGSNGAKLRVFALSNDGLSLNREVPIQQPEHFAEGAFMHRRNGLYYLSYSDGFWNSSAYSVHYSTATSPLGPWTYRGAILKSDRRYKGPGHHSFVENADKSWSIIYHRWEGSHGDGPYTGQRKVVIQPFTYLPDGSIRPIMMSNP